MRSDLAAAQLFKGRESVESVQIVAASLCFCEPHEVVTVQRTEEKLVVVVCLFFGFVLFLSLSRPTNLLGLASNSN